MSKNKQQARPINLDPVPFTPATTQPDIWETIDRRQRILAGLGLYALGLVVAFGGVRTGTLQKRGLVLLGVEPQPSLTATAGAILQTIQKEWEE